MRSSSLTFSHDCKLAYRRLRRSPGFAATAIATLALAIGANSAIFAIADAVLFRPLPYDDPARLSVLSMMDRQTGALYPNVPYVYVRAIAEQHRGIAGIGLRGPTMMTVHGAGGGETEWMETLAVTPEYFRVLGIRAARGRLFEPGDAAEPGHAVMLTHDSWVQRFGADDHVIGRTIRLGTDARTIVGILPRGFVFPATSLQFLYTQTGRPGFVTVARAPRDAAATPGAPIVMAGAATNPALRLRPGVTRDQAQAEIEAIIAPLRAARANGADEILLISDPRAVLFPTGRPIMAWLVAAAALVLLVGCANLTNLLLAANRRRERETGLQLALGATRFRIIRPIVLETLMVSVTASLLALVVTALTFDALLRQVPPAAYGSAVVRVDVRVALFTLALGTLGGVLFAVLPALASASTDVRALLQRSGPQGPRRRVLGPSLIAGQVALAVVLVFGAGIAARTFVSVLSVRLGFTPDGVVAINARPNPEPGRSLRAFYTSAIEALSRRADVVAVGAGGSVPPDGFRSVELVDGAPGQRAVGIVFVLPGYFEALDIRVTRGRLLSWQDVRSGATAAVIAESTARALFPGADPIGRTFAGRSSKREFVVIGVVGDVTRSLGKALEPPAYVIPADDSMRGMTLVARMRSRRPSTLGDVRRDVAELAPQTPVTGVWWSESVSALTAYRNPRFQTLVLGSFAALALGLTGLGVFGLIVFLLAARTREMGVRLALGAPPPSLVRMMVRQAVIPVAVGCAAGLAAVHALRRFAEAQLFQIDARDPLLLAAAVLVVLAAAFLAAYVPARRASRIDPLTVLRAE
jgi:putative ABC transport system permease protein